MIKNLHDELSITGKGGRNTAAYNAALKIGNFVAGAGLDQDHAIEVLLDACKNNGLTEKDGAHSVRATILSGIRYGKKKPRAVPNEPPGESEPHRRIVLTPASAIKPRRVRWLWTDRLALGTLALLAGREGLGKSILAYTIAAMITRGMLPGEHIGTPRAVLIAAIEDSWSRTIVPRLIAADADLDLVFRVEILADEVHRELDLPVDLARVREAVEQTGAVLLILDPLLSRLSDRLDPHKDADVRLALEPLVATADVANISVWGLIHHNKAAAVTRCRL